MRIAISGTHRVGKTTLAGLLAESLRGHELVEEPYVEMQEGGHPFSHPPTAEDFREQLEHSLRSVSHGAPGLVFDRGPVDLLAYLMVASGEPTDALREYGARVEEAMRSLDAVILVPVESPDRIEDATTEDDTVPRDEIEATLRELLFGSWLELAPEVLEVSGSPRERLTAALNGIRSLPTRSG